MTVTKRAVNDDGTYNEQQLEETGAVRKEITDKEGWERGIYGDIRVVKVAVYKGDNYM